MTNFWPLTFGLMGFWFVAGIIDLIRTPTSSADARNSTTSRPIPN